VGLAAANHSRSGRGVIHSGGQALTLPAENDRLRIFPEIPELFGSAVYASAQFKAAKPDPACYLGCLAAMAARPSETLFIDDAQVNVDGAERTGLAGNPYRSLDALRAFLEEQAEL
jgi:glucose-1-phosphatase